MIELNVYNLLLVPLGCLIFYAVISRLQRPLEIRMLSSKVPSVSNGFWNEFKFSCELSMKKPQDILPLFADLVRKKGPVVNFIISGRSCVLLNDPDDIKVVLMNSQHITKGPEYEMLKPWLNEGLLVSAGAKWQSRRKLLTNTFHFKTLNMYNPSINKHSRVLAKKLLEASENDQEISIMDYVTLCSLDIICETIMGTEMNAQEGKSVEYVQAIKCACRSVVERIFKFWLWNDTIFSMSKSGRIFKKSVKILHDYTDNVIKSKRMAMKKFNSEKSETESKYEKQQTKSFLDLLLSVVDEYPDQMTDKDIREEVDTFLFEGHDTSSISMSMTLVLLGLYPEVQERAREELQCIFGDSDRDASIDDLNEMKYLDAIIKESLRLYPSVPGITRELNTTLNIKNYSLPPTTTIVIYPYILHRREDIFPNPEEFNPERFLDTENRTKFLFGYLPFSAGARNCIGKKYAMYQLKTAISAVLRKARIETLGTKEEIKISMQLIIRIESLPKVKFHAI